MSFNTENIPTYDFQAGDILLQNGMIFLFTGVPRNFYFVHVGYYEDDEFCDASRFFVNNELIPWEEYGDRVVHTEDGNLYSAIYDSGENEIFASVGPFLGICDIYSYHYGNIPPETPIEGTRWFKPKTSTVYTYFQGQWVEFFE